ncbi:threonine-phosphate decarboxylase CobD [Nitrospira moscoviensis]|uniref:threonine-phosphate decarboxylase n=1 Tax=Nitrospira moscoviensis TaxID=42253 RepID=A0A0K2GBD4_NITMO|nr:threonine-phosphate decarboxylase CobD [Nitrospira moscoviensis]ALA58260.1 Threonine-phosphate decarboxylase [Nitrospira moscoviensis]
MADLTCSQHAHGGNVYAAARELGRSVDKLIDFSASINPLGPAPGALRAVRRARVLEHYPDPDCWALRQALASRWRCDMDQIIVGNGSTELIHLLPTALRMRHLLVIGPTFSEYAAAMERSGGRVTAVLADRADGYAPPLVRAIEAIGANAPKRKASLPIDSVLLCNPNSPTGQACDVKEVAALARAAQRRNVRLILDETFVDYCVERSVLPVMDDVGQAIVLRSFTKFFGLPGLRIGYLVTDADTAQRIRARQIPWSVNALAQEAALAALADERHARRSRSFMVRERARFLRLLDRLPGCVPFPSQANFVLMELPRGWHARAVTAALRRQGIVIRDCSTVPGLNQRSIRMAVRARRDNDRLVRILAELLGSR